MLRPDAPVLLATAVRVPTVLRRDGWCAHVVRFGEEHTAGAEAYEAVVPDDASLARAAPRRLAAYMVGRYCAARALDAAGHPPVVVPVGEAGAPAWPAGVVGSISHAQARAVALVADAGRWRSVGVDCERVLEAGQTDEIAALVLREADAIAVAGGGALTWPELVTVGFSAKESLYKCLRPLVGAFFDFDDAHLVRLDRAAGVVRLRLTRDLARGFGRGDAFDVRYAVEDGHAYTVCALARVPMLPA